MAPRKTRGSAAKEATPLLPAQAPSADVSAVTAGGTASRDTASLDTASRDTVKAKMKSNPKPAPKVMIDPNALLHGLGVKAAPGVAVEEDQEKNAQTNTKRARKTKQRMAATEDDFPDNDSTKPKRASSVKQAAVKKKTTAIQTPDGKLTVKKVKRSKKSNQYGVEIGLSPYPDWKHPTAEEAYEVHRRLTEVHGEVKAPVDIPAPSRDVAGCGEVKYVLEAILRTHLSTHITMESANKAIQAMIARYSTIDIGLYAGTIDWNAVRLAGQTELETTLKARGNNIVKAREIIQILDTVYEENQAIRNELKPWRTSSIRDQPQEHAGSDKTNGQHEELFAAQDDPEVYMDTDAEVNEIETTLREVLRKLGIASDAKAKVNEFTIETRTELDSFAKAGEPLVIRTGSKAVSAGELTRGAVMTDCAEITLCVENDLLTLDYLFDMTDQEVFNKLIKFPGVGVKTAACVLLFCFQRPFFAIDTHVFRFCQWLGWVPPNATRDTTFAHCDTLVPNELKYGLHQLMIFHGKTCAKCKASTSRETCGLESAMRLGGSREAVRGKKGGEDIPKPIKRKKKVKDDDDADNQEEADTPKPKPKRARGNQAAKTGSASEVKPAATKKTPTPRGKKATTTKVKPKKANVKKASTRKAKVSKPARGPNDSGGSDFSELPDFPDDDGSEFEG